MSAVQLALDALKLLDPDLMFEDWENGQGEEIGVQLRKAAASLEAEIAQVIAPAWRSIETAPQSDEIDIWSCGCRTPECVFGKPTCGKELGWIYESYRDSDGPVYELVRNPTHWMPTPAAPVVDK